MHGSHCTAKLIPMRWQQHGALSLPPQPGSPTSPAGGLGASCLQTGSGKHKDSPQNLGPLPPALSCSCRGPASPGGTRERVGFFFFCCFFNTKSPYFCPNPLPIFFFLHPIDHSIKNWQQPLCQRFSRHREWKEGKKVSLDRLYIGASFGFCAWSSGHEQRSKSPRLASKPHFSPPKFIRILSLMTPNWLHGNSFLLSVFIFYIAGDGWPKGWWYISHRRKKFPFKFWEGILQYSLCLGLGKREKWGQSWSLVESPLAFSRGLYRKD